MVEGLRQSGSALLLLQVALSKQPAPSRNQVQNLLRLDLSHIPKFKVSYVCSIWLLNDSLLFLSSQVNWAVIFLYEQMTKIRPTPD